MADPAGDVAATAAPVRGVAWEAFTRFRIVGHDGMHAKVVCLQCPANQPTYAIHGSLAGLIKWAAEHWQFLHQTQVAARE